MAVEYICTVEEQVKGIVSREEYFLKAYYNKQALSVHALMFFTVFCFLVDKKIKLKVLAYLLTNFLPVTRFKEPKASILILKMHKEAAYYSVRLYQKRL